MNTTEDTVVERQRVRAMLIQDELRLIMRQIGRLKARQARLREILATTEDA